MILSWKHKGLKRFYEVGDMRGIQARHAPVLSMLLLQLASACHPSDMNTPGNNYHKLKGDLKNYHAVSVSGNWRIIFQFEGKDAVHVDLVDYH